MGCWWMGWEALTPALSRLREGEQESCQWDEGLELVRVYSLSRWGRGDSSRCSITKPGMRCVLRNPSAPPKRGDFRGSGPRVFERSEFARTPRKSSTAGEPEGPAQRGCAGRTACRACFPTRCTRLRQAQPERLGRCERTGKSTAPVPPTPAPSGGARFSAPPRSA